ncbi:MAG: dienelactone hydrolase family protein [Gammaproteobacteria bacterium]|nr:dienelactone hydrolase family protein [Gammaproteobacteria bacterium]
MKLLKLSIITVLSLFITQITLATDLGNHNKKFTDPTKMSKKDWTDPDELERVWKAALVRIPKDNGKFDSSIMKDLTQKADTIKKHPTIIYLHGCSGVWEGTYRRLNFFAKSGFAVIAPVSFAREKYPQSCDVKSHKGSMYRFTLKMRQIDAGYAIEKAKQLDWVDPNNVFLVGLSQGGVTTATYSSKNPGMSVKARVIEGWTCHAGWHEYRGINASKNEPVLSVLGYKDPWFKNSWSRGDCGSYMKNEASRSVVFKDGHLSTRHELLENKSVQNIVLDFLKKQIH